MYHPEQPVELARERGRGGEEQRGWESTLKQREEISATKCRFSSITAAACACEAESVGIAAPYLLICAWPYLVDAQGDEGLSGFDRFSHIGNSRTPKTDNERRRSKPYREEEPEKEEDGVLGNDDVEVHDLCSAKVHARAVEVFVDEGQ